MKRLILLAAFVANTCTTYAQIQYGTPVIDSLTKQAVKPTNDSVKAQALYALSWEYAVIDLQQGLKFGQEALKLSTQLGWKKGIAESLNSLALNYQLLDEVPKALDYFQQARKISEEIGDKHGVADRSRNIAHAYNNLSDNAKALSYSKMAIKICEEINDKPLLAATYETTSDIYIRQADYQTGFLFLQKSLKLYEEIGNKPGIATALSNIAFIYDCLGEADKAIEFYERGVKMLNELGNKNGMARNLSNMGVVYQSKGDYIRALDYTQRALKINRETGKKNWQAINLLNIGEAYMNLADFPRAFEYLQESLKLSNGLTDRDILTNVFLILGKTYFKQGDYKNALRYTHKALPLFRKTGAVDLEIDALKQLADIYEKTGEKSKSFDYYKEYISLRDSIFNLEKLSQITQTEMKYAADKAALSDSLIRDKEKLKTENAHREEVNRKNRTRNILMGIGAFVLLIAAGLYNRLRYTRKSKAVLQTEKDRSENLLLNILPADIAEELKRTGKAEARDFENVSIVFTDFKDFTQVSETLSAKQLVAEINVCFEAFDKILSKHGIEKIKTIGDAYMAAGGLPIPTHDSTQNTVLAALEMQAFMLEHKRQKEQEGKPAFEMRLGIHTGPVVAGIVGVKKFQYDVWGDTVNTASRMESSGEVGKVNISSATYELIKTNFACTYRGKVEAKHKGMVDMYFVDAVK